MTNDEKEIRELRRLLRDLVALATTPAVWVGRDRAQIAEGVTDVLLHTLRADAVYVCLQAPKIIEAVRSPRHPGFSDEVRRLWTQSAIAGLHVDTITLSMWPDALRVAMQPIGISGDDGFIVVGCAGSIFPSEAQALLLSVAANQAAVALQAARLRMQAELERHRLQHLLAKAPAAIGLLSGPEHRWVYVNENYLHVTGRDNASHFLGKTLRESLPEIETQPFIELLDNVYRTGEPYVGREMKAKLTRAHSGQPEEGYFDFVYQPVRNAEGAVEGILVHAVEVTDKVTARQELEKRERQFREMIDALPAAIYTTDAEGRLTHFNPAAVEFSGHEPHLGTDRWCVSWKLYHPDGTSLPHDECPMAIALKEGRVIRGAEAIAERPDGTRRWFTPYPTLLRDSQGSVVGGINMLVDITERKRAEEALADALRQQRALFQVADRLHRASSLDEIYRTAMDAICDALQCDRVSILLYDESGTMRFVSWRGLSDSYRKAVEGHSPWKRDDPNPQPVCINDIGSAQLDDELKSTILVEGIHACAFIPLVSDGKLVGKFMMYFSSPHSFADAELQLSLTIARQIAFAIERRGAEEALSDSEERFRALVNASSDVVYRMNADWTEMRQLDGKGFISDMGKPSKEWLKEYIHPDDQPLVLQTIRQAVRTKSMFELEHRVRRTDGTLGWTFSRAIPLLDAGGEIIEWFGAASDVTARKQAEENYRKLAQTLDAEVRARTRELEERNVDVLRQSEQVRDLSRRLLQAQDEERRHVARELHDSAGQTLTVLAMNLSQLYEEARKSAPQIEKYAQGAQELVQQLHQDVRTTSYLLHPPLLDETGLAAALNWYLDGLRERSDLDIKLNIAEDFGRLPRDLELVVFRLIQECLTNIHRHSGSKTASIQIVRGTTNITVDVRDEGRGMSADRLAEVQSCGSGVGIRGMRERLRQFSGNLSIESNSTGTRILVTIPIPEHTQPLDRNNPQPMQATI